MNPRDSIATTASGRRARAPSRRMHSANADGSDSIGVMSLNRMPRFGKSGTSRMKSRRSITARPPRSLHGRAALAVEFLHFDRAPQLLERTGLDLAHALARDPEVFAGLLQRTRDAVLESEADAQHLLLALAERVQNAIHALVLELQL